MARLLPSRSYLTWCISLKPSTLVVDLVKVSPSMDEFHRHLPHIPGLHRPSYEDYLKHAKAEATEYLAQLTGNLQRQGVDSVEQHLLQGDPATSIIDIASETNDRLVAMTTHGRSGLGRWVLGSVAERVVRHSGDPVLLVRATEPEAA